MPSFKIIGAIAAVLLATGLIWALPRGGGHQHASSSAPPQKPSAPSPATAPAETGGTSAKSGPSVSFRDTRIPVPSGEQDAEKAGPGPVPATTSGFTDSRPLTTPGFRDARPIAAPSFRDGRVVLQPPSHEAGPSAATTFRDARPIVGQPAEPKSSASEQQPQAAARAAALSPPAPNSPKPDRADCPAPELGAEALDGGRMRIFAAAQCRAGQPVHVSYGGAELIRAFDAAGKLDIVLDCFAGAGSTVEVRYSDGARQMVAAAANDLDKVSKVAVIWRAPINLDLHVFEYAARFGQAGHVWAKAASSIAEAQAKARADRRGHGFLSSTDSEQSVGDKVEVYTLLHEDAQTAGAIGLALDYETRGDLPSGATCGEGALAEVDFQVVILPRGGKPARQSGVLTRADCGTRLTPEARFNQATLPGLRIRR